MDEMDGMDQENTFRPPRLQPSRILLFPACTVQLGFFPASLSTHKRTNTMLPRIRSCALAFLALSAPGFAQDALIISGDTLAFLGDSITEGGAGHPAGYVRRVESGLEANGIKIHVVGAGISGHKSNQMLERLQRDVLHKKPTWMTLSCGVNDVWHGANGVPLPEYKKNITEIVDKAQAAGIKVMLLTSTVIGEDLDNENNAKLKEYNDFLRTLAKEKNCRFADLNADMQTILKAKPSKELRLTSDGVHMNPLGDRVMAAGILKEFGLSPKQLETANDHWYHAPKTCTINSGIALSLKQYEQLRDMADSRGVSLHTLVQDESNKAVLKLLEPGK